MRGSRLYALTVVVALIGGLLLVTGATPAASVLAVAPAPPAASTIPPDDHGLPHVGTDETRLAGIEWDLTEAAADRTTTTLAAAPATATTSTSAPRPARQQAASVPAPSSTTGSTTSTLQPATTTIAVPTTTSTVAAQSAAGFSATDEAAFAQSINSLRAAQGLAPLTRDGSLDAGARAWAKTLAERGDLAHSDLSQLVPPWAAAGENVGMGGSVSSLFDALVASSGHLANMVGDFTHFGVGVYADADGVLWTAHQFTR